MIVPGSVRELFAAGEQIMVQLAVDRLDAVHCYDRLDRGRRTSVEEIWRTEWPLDSHFSVNDRDVEGALWSLSPVLAKAPSSQTKIALRLDAFVAGRGPASGLYFLREPCLGSTSL